MLSKSENEKIRNKYNKLGINKGIKCLISNLKPRQVFTALLGYYIHQLGINEAKKAGKYKTVTDAKKRSDIYTAINEMIRRQNDKSITVSKIAHNAHMSRPTVYFYFNRYLKNHNNGIEIKL